MNKSPDAFRTISEVAEQLDVPAHVLRFWETRFAQVKPVKRGGGRRYYRPDDVRLLRGIRGLLYDDGMTIKGVQKILREHGVRHVIGLGTVEDAAALGAVQAPARAPAVPVEAEKVLATAGPGEDAPALPRGGIAGGRDRPPADLFGGAAALAAAPVAGAPEAAPVAGAPEAAGAEEIARPIGRKVNRDALRRLVAELEALRRVMAGERPA